METRNRLYPRQDPETRELWERDQRKKALAAFSDGLAFAKDPLGKRCADPVAGEIAPSITVAPITEAVIQPSPAPPVPVIGKVETLSETCSLYGVHELVVMRGDSRAIAKVYMIESEYSDEFGGVLEAAFKTLSREIRLV